MTKRKKRNAATLIFLLLALIILIGIYIWYGNHKVSDKADEEAQMIAVAQIDNEQLITLHYKAKDADITLIKEGDEWESKGEPDRPINQNNVKNMINIIDKIEANRIVIENPENLQDFGLDQPASYLQAVQADGQTVTLLIGNKVSTGDGYYAMVNDNDTVYLVGTSFGSGHIIGNKETTLTSSYLPYDESFYLVDTGNTIRFFADKRKVQEIADTVKEFKAANQ